LSQVSERLLPLGNTIDEYWRGLCEGVSGADYITLFDAEKFKTRFACELKNFNPEEFLDRKEARKLDRFSQLAIVSSNQAIADANLTQEGINKDRVGVIWASGIGGIGTFYEEMKGFLCWRWYTSLQSFLYSKNDFRYCRRAYFNELRI
jgi:3-oxoacyl-[acyl-carrier-protein] synthase II